MSDEPRKQLVRRWILEVWGGGNLSLVEELVSPRYVYSAPGLGEVRGHAAVKELVSTFRTAFPDLANTIEEQIAERGVVVTHGKARGTHRAPFAGIAPTGRSVTIQWIMISRFDGDRISSDFEVYDALGLLEQLGAKSLTVGA